MSIPRDDGNYTIEEQHPMTPHQKAIEAAARVLQRWYRSASDRFAPEADQYWDRRAEAIIAACLTSARESGWELNPREPTSAMKQAQFYRISNDGWREMFDAAPRFEDAQ
jgi:hypothetical protein